jgi:hypothetical protein
MESKYVRSKLAAKLLSMEMCLSMDTSQITVLHAKNYLYKG